jgi:hypothetical protein
MRVDENSTISSYYNNNNKLIPSHSESSSSTKSHHNFNGLMGSMANHSYHYHNHSSTYHQHATAPPIVYKQLQNAIQQVNIYRKENENLRKIVDENGKNDDDDDDDDL